ncbi:MAG: hypothetical protein AB8B99_22750 [Phormidesmis sp.]
MLLSKSASLVAILLSINIGLPSAVAQTLPDDTALTSLGRSLRRILRDDEQRDPPTTSRDDICLITPVNLAERETIWHHQPVFAWQGTVGKIEVIEIDTNASLWQHIPENEETTIAYSGEPLQSGKRYQWQVYGVADLESPLLFQPFSLVSRPTQWLIANGLAVAASQTDGSAQNIAVAHVNYFTNRALYADAIQVLFSADPDAPEILAGQTEIIKSLCQQ